MSKYRKKPVVIEAFRWEKGARWPLWFEAAVRDGTVQVLGGVAVVRTLEGETVTAVEDRNWILRGVAGELYPCRADIFEATYEEAGDVTSDCLPEGK